MPRTRLYRRRQIRAIGAQSPISVSQKETSKSSCYRQNLALMKLLFRRSLCVIRGQGHAASYIAWR